MATTALTSRNGAGGGIARAPNPSGLADVIDLILDDHRRFERLLRDLRDSSSDRDAVRRALATLHTAHAIAEETHVYPKLERKDAITEDEAEHG